MYADHVKFKRQVKQFESTINPMLADIDAPAINYWYENDDVKQEIKDNILMLGAVDGAKYYYYRKYDNMAI